MSHAHRHPPPDQALAEHPADYSDPELKEYTDEFAQDILDEVMPIMPLVLPLMAGLQMFMLAFIAVVMA